MKKITSEMVDSLINEIEKPLITADELGLELGMNSQQINWLARKLKIEPYRIKDDRYYKKAYDEEMVRKMLAFRKELNIVVRKNKLDIKSLIEKT
jgi:hypothetical protein